MARRMLGEKSLVNDNDKDFSSSRYIGTPRNDSFFFLKVCYAIWKYHIAQPYNANSFSKLLKIMRLAENESRRVGMKFEALVELSQESSDVGLVGL